MTEEEEFSTVVFVKVDCDELEVCITISSSAIAERSRCRVG